MDIKGRFAGIDKATMTERGVPLGPIRVKGPDGNPTGQTLDATYKLRVDRLLDKDTTKGRAFIAELIVVESDNPDHPVGQKRTWFQKMDGTSKMVGLGAVKAFALSALQIDSNNEAEVAKVESGLSDVLDAAVGSTQALKGQLVNCRVVEILTKETKKPFSLHAFSPGNPPA